jgi:hypothetical protein
MAITETAAIYAQGPRNIETGKFAQAMVHTVAATASASANALVVLGQKVQNGLYIMGIDGYHSSGADSCPADIGIASNLSVFATAKTQGVNFVASNAKAGVFPYLVSMSDSAVPQYQVVKYALTPGTNTTGIILKYSITVSRNPY